MCFVALPRSCGSPTPKDGLGAGLTSPIRVIEVAEGELRIRLSLPGKA
jgi:hypothetical protein